jgi:hypothetical protein
MEPINSAAFPSPEADSTAAEPGRESRLIGQHADFQDAFPIRDAPIQSSARLQPGFPDNLGRNSHLVLSRNSRNHGEIMLLDFRIVKDR